MKIRNRGFIINPEDLNERLIYRLADSGINELGIHSGGGRRAFELVQKTLTWHKTDRVRELFALAESLGICVEYDEHALRSLVPADLFDAHPDWFRMDENGVRRPDFNICASNREALSYLSGSAACFSLALKTPSHRYAYWVDDVLDSCCHCPECRALSPADQALTLTNAILRGIKRVDPFAITGFLAYNEAMDVPQNVRPEEGVYLEYAPINRDSERPIDDPDCVENRRETEKLPALLAFFGTKNARVLEYWMDNSRFSNWTRPPKAFHLNGEVMRRDAVYYSGLGFEDMTTFGCYLGEDYEALYGDAPIEEYGKILNGACASS